MCNTINDAARPVGLDTNELQPDQTDLQGSETPAGDKASIDRQLDAAAESRSNPVVVPDEAVKVAETDGDMLETTVPKMKPFSEYQSEDTQRGMLQVLHGAGTIGDKFQMLAALLTDSRAKDPAPWATELVADGFAKDLVLETLDYAKHDGKIDTGFQFFFGKLQFADTAAKLEALRPELAAIKAAFEAKPEVMTETVREAFAYVERNIDHRIDAHREFDDIKTAYSLADTPDAAQAVVDRLEALLLPDPEDPFANVFTPSFSKDVVFLLESYRGLSQTALEEVTGELNSLTAKADAGRFDFKADLDTLTKARDTLQAADGCILQSDIEALEEKINVLTQRIEFMQTFEESISSIDVNSSYQDAAAVRHQVDELIETYPGAEPHYQAAVDRADAKLKLVHDRARAGQEFFLNNIRAQIKPGNLDRVLTAIAERRDQIFDDRTVGLTQEEVAQEFEDIRDIELKAQYTEFEAVLSELMTSEETPKTFEDLSRMIAEANEDAGPIEDDDAQRMQANLRELSSDLGKAAIRNMEALIDTLDKPTVTLSDLYHAREAGVVENTARLLPADREAVSEAKLALNQKIDTLLTEAAVSKMKSVHPALSEAQKDTFIRLFRETDCHAGFAAAADTLTPAVLNTLGTLMETKAGLSSADDRLKSVVAADAALRRLGDENPELQPGLTRIRQLCSADPDRVAQEEKSDGIRHQLKLLLDSRFGDGKLEKLGIESDSRSVTSNGLKSLVDSLSNTKDLHKVDLLILKAFHDDLTILKPDLTLEDFKAEIPEKYQSLPLERLFTSGLESTLAQAKAERTATGFSKAATVGYHLNDEMLAVGRRLVVGDDKFAASSALNMLMRHAMRNIKAEGVARQTRDKDFDGHRIFNNEFTSHRGDKQSIGIQALGAGIWHRIEMLSSLEKTKTHLKTLTGSLDKLALGDTADQINTFVDNSDALLADLSAIHKDLVAKGVMEARAQSEATEVEMLESLADMRPGRPEIAKLKEGKIVPVHGARVGMGMLILDRLLDKAAADPQAMQKLASRLSFQRHINLDTMESTGLHAKMEDYHFRDKFNDLLAAKTNDQIMTAVRELKGIMTANDVVNKAHTVLYFKDFGGVTDRAAFDKAFERTLTLSGRAKIKEFDAIKAELFPADRVAAAAQAGTAEAARAPGESRPAAVGGHRNNFFERKAFRDAQQQEIQKMTRRIAENERVFNVRVKNELRNAAKIILLETFISYPGAKTAKDVMNERGVYTDLTVMPFYKAALATANKLGLSEIAQPYLLQMIADLKENSFQKMEADIADNIRIKWDSFKTRMTARSRDERAGFRKEAMAELAGGALTQLRSDTTKTFTLDVDRRAGSKGLVPVVKTSGATVNARLSIAQQNGLSLFSDGGQGFTLMLSRAGGVEVSASVSALKSRLNAAIGANLKGANGTELHFVDGETCQEFMSLLLSSQLKARDVTRLADKVLPLRSFGMDGRVRAQLMQKAPDFIVKPVEDKIRNRHSLDAIDPNEDRVKGDETALSAHLAMKGDINWTSKHIGDDIERTRVTMRHFDTAIGLTRHSLNPTAGDNLTNAAFSCDYKESLTERRGPDKRLKSALRTRTAETSSREEVEAFLDKQQVPSRCRADVLFRAAGMNFRCKLDAISLLPKHVLDTNPTDVRQDDFVRSKVRLTGVEDRTDATKGFLVYHRHFEAKNASVYTFDATDRFESKPEKTNI